MRLLLLWTLVLSAFGVWLWMLGHGGYLGMVASLAAVLLAAGVGVGVALEEWEERRQRR